LARKSQAEIDLGSLGKGKKKDKKNKNRKYGRNLKKCANYRLRVGKPLGRGVSGNKRGKSHV
jgi:hypothetical protein